MSRSTFSGPVLSGIDNAPYSTDEVAYTGANWGFAKMVQSYPIEEQGGLITTSIIIPQKSVITRISALVSVAWAASGTNIVNIGSAWGAYPGPDVDLTDPSEYDTDDLVKDWDLSAVGMKVAGPGDTDNLTAGDINNWMNLPREAPFADRFVIYDTIDITTGAGRAVLTVEYCQAVNLEAIA